MSLLNVPSDFFFSTPKTFFAYLYNWKFIVPPKSEKSKVRLTQKQPYQISVYRSVECLSFFFSFFFSLFSTLLNLKQQVRQVFPVGQLCISKRSKFECYFFFFVKQRMSTHFNAYRIEFSVVCVRWLRAVSPWSASRLVGRLCGDTLSALSQQKTKCTKPRGTGTGKLVEIPVGAEIDAVRGVRFVKQKWNSNLNETDWQTTVECGRPFWVLAGWWWCDGGWHTSAPSVSLFIDTSF